MEELINYYNEHAIHARLHEDQRERMTNIMLSIAGVLIGLVTYSGLSVWSLPASLTICILGIFGFFFAGKHYERFKRHNAIMRKIKKEMDDISSKNDSPRLSLKKLRENGEEEHYSTFVWPKFSGSNSGPQCTAKSWISRQRMHTFWESLHILIFFMGLGLTIAIITKCFVESTTKPIKIEIIKK